MKRLVVFALSLFVLAACSSTSDRSLIDQRELLSDARITVLKMVDSEEFPQLRGYMQKARAVLIVPNLYKAGFVLGGEYGNAVLIAQNGAINSNSPILRGGPVEQVNPILPTSGATSESNAPIESEPLKPQSRIVLDKAYGLVMASHGQWSNPVFYSMTSGSIGLQIGGQDQETIFTIMTQKGLNALLNRSVKLGADASIAIGPVGKGVEAATALAKQADIYAFSKAEGLYGGGSLEGSVISEKGEWNMALYGSQTVPKQILTMSSSNLPEIEALRKALP